MALCLRSQPQLDAGGCMALMAVLEAVGFVDTRRGAYGGATQRLLLGGADEFMWCLMFGSSRLRVHNWMHGVRCLGAVQGTWYRRS